MSTYIMGDIQGCFNSLEALLSHISYTPDKDQLGFVGDLVNRGPKSLETLRFIYSLDEPLIVLGNHDLHLLAHHFGVINKKSHFLLPILEAHDREPLLNWLLAQPLMLNLTARQSVMVHAGIPPQWSTTEANAYAIEASCALKKNPEQFLSNMYGNRPEKWDKALSGYDRFRYIINALTRMRFCKPSGELDLTTKTNHTSNPDVKPWFHWRAHDTKRILFGHWASLEGRCPYPNMVALDTGCVWGGRLTAIRLEDMQLFSVTKQEK